MLTIVMSPYKGSVITADGQRMNVYPAFFERGGKLARINGCKGLGGNAEIEILRVYRTGTSLQKRRMRLPRAVVKGVALFFDRYHDKQDIRFDCYAFANLVHGLPPHDKKFARAFWETAATQGEVKAGETVFLMSDDDHSFLHAAIYLGGHRYISVYGAGGHLEISSLEDMVRDFSAKRVLLATPR